MSELLNCSSELISKIAFSDPNLMILFLHQFLPHETLKFIIESVFEERAQEVAPYFDSLDVQENMRTDREKTYKERVEETQVACARLLLEYGYSNDNVAKATRLASKDVENLRSSIQ